MNLCLRCLNFELTTYGRLHVCYCGWYQVKDSWETANKITELTFKEYKLKKQTDKWKSN